jgi:UDP:flavonoid glycosyltransferase YjiC (YdhE family)
MLRPTQYRRPYNPAVSDIILYVTGHGFGHAVRSSQLCRALLDAAPGLTIGVRTTAPSWIFPSSVAVEPCTIDVGVVQPNSLDIDAHGTLERYAAHVATEPPLLAAEAQIVRESGARVVVADAPAAAFEIAARAGVPGIGLANFTWDWIYEPFLETMPERAPLVDHLREQYALATLLLRLPFHGDMSAFGRIEDVPLIGRRATVSREETRRRLGLPLDLPLVVFSFGGHATAGPDAARLAALDGYGFVMTSTAVHAKQVIREGRNLFVLPELSEGYVDLLAASDAVIMKPGYGIVADLLANRVPALYVSRDGFREEPILIRALEEEGRAVPLPRAALDALDLGPALDRLLSLDTPWTTRPIDGAQVAARRILEIAGLTPT